MKKTVKTFTVLLLCIALSLGAAVLNSCTAAHEDGDKLKILCTVFPVYSWAQSVVGESENVEVSLLVENGTDLHSFQPSFGDMAKIKDSDIVVYIGGESDKWVAESIDESAVALELSELDGMTLYEVSADSIVSSHTHEDGEECHEAHDHAHGFDEHIWLSLSNAAVAADELCRLLCELDADGTDIYNANTQSFKASLSELDARMSALSEKISAPLIFADRFPLIYFLEDYGIDYIAAFEGCSTDTGANFDTVITLAKRVDEYGAQAVFVTEAPVDGLAEGVIAQTSSKDAKIAALDSMQSFVANDMEGELSYISVTRSNIEILEAFFN